MRRTILVALLCIPLGCAYLDYQLPKFPPEKEEEVPAGLKDAIDASTVSWHGVDVGGWKITHSLVAGASGNNVQLITDATDVWPEMVRNVGSCWFIVKRDGKWHGYRWDQIRKGQKLREFPWNPPHPKGDDSYATAKKREQIYITISSMARGNQRTVNERTPIVELAQ